MDRQCLEVYLIVARIWKWGYHMQVELFIHTSQDTRSTSSAQSRAAYIQEHAREEYRTLKAIDDCWVPARKISTAKFAVVAIEQSLGI